MLSTILENWDKILEYLRNEFDEISDVSFRTWIEPLRVIAVDERTHVITILVTQANLGTSYIEKKYGTKLSAAIEEITLFRNTLAFTENPDYGKEAERKVIKKPALSTAREAGLNEKYTFDSFVVGSNNKMAHAASLAVAESPGVTYNPLFIYGGVGLGKTHLMHAIGNFILKNDPSKKLKYVTSEVFTNELIDSIRNNNTQEFREKYRTNDVLMIDDIQFIIGKESTQEEFFHTFNTMHDASKQIIISSDRPPKEFNTLEERLVSRFEWGMTADIQSPDYETRMAILRKKEEVEGYNIDNEVIQYIATNIQSNIRELEGALTRVIAASKLDKREIDLKLAEESLKDILSPNQKKEINCAYIIDRVAEHFSIPQQDLISAKRSKEIVRPRQIAMYLCRVMTTDTQEMIGRAMGRDHTTIIHGIDKISKELETDQSLQNTIEILKKKIDPN